MSGNSVGFAANVARAQWREAGIRGLPVPFFVVGIVLGALVAEAAARRRSRHPLATALMVELAAVAALTAAGVSLAPRGSVGAPLGWRFCVIASLAAFAMGLQNGMVRRLDPRSRGTTYVTGLLTLIGESLASKVLRRLGRVDAASEATVPYVAVYVAYIVGAGATGLLYQTAAFAALAIPIAGLVALIVAGSRAPW